MNREGTLQAAWSASLEAGAAILGALASGMWVFGADRLGAWPVMGLTGSWAVPATLAALLIVVRRFTARGPSLRQHLLARLSASPGLRTALPLFLTTRVAVLLVGYLTLVTIGLPSGTFEWRVSDDLLWNMPARWDTGWYLDIAERGYHWFGRNDLEQNIVFFPAFPMAMRAAGRLLGGRYLLGGMLVSLGAFLWALVYLYRLARRDVGHDAAAMSLALVATYPFAVFFGTAYTESLYLLAAVGAVYHFRREEWLRASAWGLLVGLTRPNGMLVAAPLAVMCVAPLLRPHWPRLGSWLGGGEAAGREPARLSIGAMAAAGMPVAGLLCYAAFNAWLTGDPLAWMHAVSAWGRAVPGAQAPAGVSLGWSLGDGLQQLLPTSPKELFNIASGLFMAALVIPVTRRFGLPYGLFVFLVLLPPILSGGSESLGRYTLVLFPAFIWLGERIPASHRAGWLIGFGILQGVGAALFFTWRPFY